MLASAKTVVFEWPSSPYMHIKSISAGYEKSTTFANKQILIRPAANNQSLVISTRSNSSEKWTFVKHLSYPLNPTNIQNLGQKTQPCKSKHKEVVFNVTSKKELYKKKTKKKSKPYRTTSEKYQVLNSLLAQREPPWNSQTDIPHWLQPPP